MAERLSDVDLDALAPPAKRVKLGGRWHKVPGDIPLDLFLRLQSYGQRIEAGVDEVELLDELKSELVKLFRVHQPDFKELPSSVGVRTLMGSLAAIYGGAVGEAHPPSPTPPQRKRTASGRPAKRPAKATSR